MKYFRTNFNIMSISFSSFDVILSCILNFFRGLTKFLRWRRLTVRIGPSPLRLWSTCGTHIVAQPQFPHLLPEEAEVLDDVKGLVTSFILFC